MTSAMTSLPVQFTTQLTRRRCALKSMGGLVLMLGAGEIAWGASIVAVRVWPAADYTRVTIESDTPLEYKYFMAEAPSRLVIDIDGLELGPALRDFVGKVQPDDPFIAVLRAGQNQPRVVRLVIELKQPTRPQLFTLRPVAAYQHRLVFDLYPTQARDPLLALLEDKGIETSDAQAPSTPQVPQTSASAPSSPNTASSVSGAVRKKPVTSDAISRSTAQRKINRLIVVAIDPGHGGEDPGASGSTGLREKEVVLALALQLRDHINSLPNMRAMLTREADFFVPLNERVQKARRVQADVFVSIHADAFMAPEARGASVFALSQRGASSATARWMANRENASDVVGGTSLKAKDASVVHTLLDMSTTAQIRDSLKLADEVLSQIGKLAKLHKGHVEQAGFAVLKAPDIPSILVEAAFISNPEEEAKLRDPGYQTQLVRALGAGIQRYFAKNPPLAHSRRL
jgi:N-acetylmuramoyl-L-alanine amidase